MTKTIGERIVEEFMTQRADDGYNRCDDECQADLIRRIDEALATANGDVQKRTLDLSEVFTFPKSGKKTGDWYLSAKGVVDAIKTQLPDIEVITD